MIPSLGRIVIYQLSEKDAEVINRRRTSGDAIAHRIQTGQWPIGAQAHIGEIVQAGDEFPLIIVRTKGYLVNGQVLLDGNDVKWVQEVPMGNGPGGWHWPARVADPVDFALGEAQVRVPRPPNCF